MATLRWRRLTGTTPTAEPAFTARVVLAAVRVGRCFILPFRLLTFAAILYLLRDLWQSGGSIESKALLPLGILVLLTTFTQSFRDIKLWAFYIGAFMAFVEIRTLADETGMPLQTSYPVALDKLLLLGELPTTWLQEHLASSAIFEPFEIALVVVYVSYFFAPHLMVIVLWRLRPDLFPRIVATIALTLHIALFIHFLLPTAPPWLASDLGDAPAVTRLMPEVLSDGDYDQAARVAGDNDVAAMPSLHMGLTVVIALAAASFGKKWRYASRIYAASMGFALVYLGEHYVVDLTVGALIAILAWMYCAQGLRVPVGLKSSFFAGQARTLEPPAVTVVEASVGDRTELLAGR